jgi:hypothetical protein
MVGPCSFGDRNFADEHPLISRSGDLPSGGVPILEGRMATVEENIINDARAVFGRYLAKTKSETRMEPLGNGQYRYPIETIENDTMVFVSLFTCLWQVFGNGKNHQKMVPYQTQNPDAFRELEHIVTKFVASDEDRCFWQGGDVLKPVDVSTAAGRYELCRTLRNGFNHFNFRFIDLSPNDYFHRLGFDLPNKIDKPGVAHNWRIFICDVDRNHNFLQAGSDSRMIETGFAHLRCHLFRFLAKFFKELNIDPYIDILTSKPLS